ncbi:hypothetical protein K431DRAFT_10534 [Polychaeton citri CBS 116435]|uniref:RING-type domain-containing protein n=1 Tax=Polychaeton citri CBS 116435 TaxID=1314669 RepID=A0A9P4QFM0_9PEZI|nr:hypothetical protein K431DRAFT_10534 [Polychaeton citri CBS 116435]
MPTPISSNTALLTYDQLRRTAYFKLGANCMLCGGFNSYNQPLPHQSNIPFVTFVCGHHLCVECLDYASLHNNLCGICGQTVFEEHSLAYDRVFTSAVTLTDLGVPPGSFEVRMAQNMQYFTWRMQDPVTRAAHWTLDIRTLVHIDRLRLHSQAIGAVAFYYVRQGEEWRTKPIYSQNSHWKSTDCQG